MTALRSMGQQDATKKSLFAGGEHTKLFRRMLNEAVDNPETDEAGGRPRRR